MFITEEQIRLIQAKEFLDLKEAALLLNVSPLTPIKLQLTHFLEYTHQDRPHQVYPKFLTEDHA
jgi:hypothetical protein